MQTLTMKMQKVRLDIGLYTSYLYSDEALFRIKEYSKGKDLKFIVMLRNPVEKHTHYLHTLRDGLENLI